MGANNLIRFESWVAERDAAGHWSDYIRGDKLNHLHKKVEGGSVKEGNSGSKSTASADLHVNEC